MPQTIIQYNLDLNKKIIEEAHRLKKNKSDIIVWIIEQYFDEKERNAVQEDRTRWET